MDTGRAAATALDRLSRHVGADECCRTPWMGCRRGRCSTGQCESGRNLGAGGRLLAAGLSFTTVTATCAPEQGEADESTAYELGATVTGAVEWTFVIRDHADDLARDRRQVLSPMLATLALAP